METVPSGIALAELNTGTLQVSLADASMESMLSHGHSMVAANRREADLYRRNLTQVLDRLAALITERLQAVGMAVGMEEPLAGGVS
jgi:hypothetical protein